MVKTATSFSPRQLVHGLSQFYQLNVKIPSLKLYIELLPGTSTLEEHLVCLEQLNEKRRDALVALEVNKFYVKVHMISLFI